MVPQLVTEERPYAAATLLDLLGCVKCTEGVDMTRAERPMKTQVGLDHSRDEVCGTTVPGGGHTTGRELAGTPCPWC